MYTYIEQRSDDLCSIYLYLYIGGWVCTNIGYMPCRAYTLCIYLLYTGGGHRTQPPIYFKINNNTTIYHPPPPYSSKPYYRVVVVRDILKHYDVILKIPSCYILNVWVSNKDPTHRYDTLLMAHQGH